MSIIQEAKKLGKVIVGILTDDAIESYKRLPIFSYEQRKFLVENIKGVDDVVSQNTLDYVPNLRKIKPDYVVHGDDWRTGVQKEFRQRTLCTNGKPTSVNKYLNLRDYPSRQKLPLSCHID